MEKTIPTSREENTGSMTKGEKTEDKELVALHYNLRPEITLESRKQSVIIRMRSFNNWIKSVLIAKYSRKDREKILDVGCGKGGDLLKWRKVNISDYVGLDIAERSVEEAERRYQKMRNRRFRARFYVHDCYGEPLSKIEGLRGFKADIVSIQFSIHYAFETEAKVRQMLSNVSEHLEQGGLLIGTTLDSYYLAKRLANSPGLSFGNSVFNIRFEKKTSESVFGRRYWFVLEDAVDDCPEYLVHFPTFIKLAREYGMEFLYKECFHDFYQKSINTYEHVDLFGYMKVVDSDGGQPSTDEWEAAGMYLIFAFRKL